jgi:hypothetical protein
MENNDGDNWSVDDVALTALASSSTCEIPGLYESDDDCFFFHELFQ